MRSALLLPLMALLESTLSMSGPSLRTLDRRSPPTTISTADFKAIYSQRKQDLAKAKDKVNQKVTDKIGGKIPKSAPKSLFKAMQEPMIKSIQRDCDHAPTEPILKDANQELKQVVVKYDPLSRTGEVDHSKLKSLHDRYVDTMFKKPAPGSSPVQRLEQLCVLEAVKAVMVDPAFPSFNHAWDAVQDQFRQKYHTKMANAYTNRYASPQQRVGNVQSKALTA